MAKAGDSEDDVPQLFDGDDSFEQTRHAEDLRLLPKRAQRPWLLVVGGKRSLGILFEVRAKLTIGRSDEVDLTLDEAGVSRVHAQVELLAGGIVKVTDLGSSNGVRIDGRKVKFHTLRDGERLRLGEAVLTMVHVEDDMQQFAKNLTASATRFSKR